VLDGEGPLPETLGLRLIAGRLAQNAANEILVSHALAQAFFASGSAVGRRLHLPDEASPFIIAGVYEDVELVIPYLANPTLSIIRQRPAGDERGSRYLVRVDAAKRRALISGLSATLLSLDPNRAYEVRAFDLKTTRHVITSDGLIDTLGIIALVLATVALLGSLAITAFLVQQRIRQVGIRRALGATPWDIVHQFLIENGLAVALGCVFGLGISLGYYFALGHLFPGVTLSPLQFGFTALLLFVDGALATLVPALRAARIPPTVASRAL
jgi:putative ABC transport system permease protein